MKPVIATLALALATAPALAQNVDMSSLTPTLSYPDPSAEPVTRTEAEPGR